MYYPANKLKMKSIFVASKESLFLLIFLLKASVVIHAQSLTELISLAHNQSPENEITETRLLNAKLNFDVYKAGFKPNIMLNANTPDLLRSITPVITDDGGQRFINRSVLTNSVDVSLNYEVRKTGGTIFASTGLQRLDVLSSPSNTSYYATPIRIGFIQPISKYNSNTWEDKKEPLKLTIAEKKFNYEKELITQNIVRSYFELMRAQLDIEYSESQLLNSQNLYGITLQRFEKGFVGKSEIIQFEIKVNSALSFKSAAELDKELAIDRLNSVIGNETIFDYVVSVIDFKDVEISQSHAIEMLQKNNPLYEEVKLNEVQSTEDIVYAKSIGRNVELIGQVGFSQTSSDLNKAYTNLADQEMISFGINIPITDWGLSKLRVQTAEINYNLTTKINAWEKLKLERDLISQIKKLDLIKTQVALLKSSLLLAEENISLTNKKYIEGSASLTDLNIALENEKGQRNAYFVALQDHWTTYYYIRGQCLYDFIEMEVINYR